MHLSPRCGARTRSGGACRAPAVGGRARCRMHGGARGSGAQRGNRNAWKHGIYGRAAAAERRWVNALLAEGWQTIRTLEGGETQGGAGSRRIP